MSYNAVQNRILAAVDTAASQILDISHQIHDHPELGYEEVYASSLLARTLEKFGFQVEMGIAGIPTAFRGVRGNPAGPRVAFLAEYDALPEIGHGCGHNFIATSALAAGIGLGAVVEELHGQIQVIGTPAEETDGSKVRMVGSGIFDDIDAALMVHPHNDNFTATISLAMDAVQATFFGKPSHAATSPWDGLNALDAVILTFNNINALRQQMMPDARIHGIITRGGAAPNIIPEQTEARFYIRAQHRTYLNQLVQRFYACAEAAASAAGCRVEFSHYENSFDDMNNNITMAERMRDYLIGLGSGPFEFAPDHFGSIDMGNVSHVIPGIHVLVDITHGEHISAHTHEFCSAAATPFADAALLRAGKSLALTGCDLLQDPVFLQKVRDEFHGSSG